MINSKNSVLILLGILCLSVLVMAGVRAGNDPDIAYQTHQLQKMAEIKGQWAAEFKDMRPIGVRDYDVQHYHLSLYPDIDESTLAGQVVIQALSNVDALQMITLDMRSSLETLAVTNVGGVDLAYLRDGHTLEIDLGAPFDSGELFEIVIDYQGTPSSYVFSFGTHQGVPIFATASEPTGARHWWPCNDVPDDKALVDLDITVPEAITVAANGLLVDDVSHGDGTHTQSWHHTYPVSTYLVAVAGSNYETIAFEYIPVTGGDPMPVPVYTYPEMRAECEVDFAYTVDMLEFFSTNFGEYPFLSERYGQVLTHMGGGMENQTITHVNAAYVYGNGHLDWLVAHELAHQWWGDCLTLKTWEDIWLNESFATYSDALYQEYRYGPEHLADLMRSYAAREYTGSIYDPVYLFDSIVYQKGAIVLHMLRNIVGESNFWLILQTYYSDVRFSYANVETADFIEICGSVSGMDLDWFFQQWIYGAGRPHYQVSWDYTQEAASYEITLRLVQIQTEQPLFIMPLDIRIHHRDGSTDFAITVDEVDQTFVFQTSEIPLGIEFDPMARALFYESMAPDQFQFLDETVLPAANYGEIYNKTLELSGGEPPFTFEIFEGEFPWGITFQTDTGIISGFPLENGRHNVTILATDSRTPPRYAAQPFSLRARNAMAVMSVKTDSETYTGGDTLTVSLNLDAKIEVPVPSRIFVILDVAGVFFFLDFYGDTWPAFSETPGMVDFEIPPEFSLEADLFSIPLPEGINAFSGTWYGLLMSPGNGTALGPVSISEFAVN